MEKEINLKTSVLNYIGAQNNGVSILISLTLDSISFRCIYWIHPDGYHTLECEKDFLKLFGVKDTDNLPFLEELIEDIDSLLPEKNKIFKNFL